MTPFGLSGLLTGITSVSFGVFVLLMSANRKIGRIWFLFTLAVGCWGFGGMWVGWTKTATEGLLAWRLAYALGVIWIAPLFYHFVCTFLELRRNRSIILHYLITLSFLSTIPTTLFFSRARWVFNSLYYGLGGVLYPFYFAWWIGLVLYSHYELIRIYKGVSPSKKNQIKYFFLATAVGYTGGSLAYLPNFGVDVYPWGNFAIVLYPLIMSIAIARYRLMDIDLLARNTTGWLYAGVLSALPFVFSASLAHLFWTWPHFASNNGPGSLICCIADLSIVLTLFTIYQNPHAKRLCWFFIFLTGWNATAIFLCMSPRPYSVLGYRFGYGLACLVAATWVSFWRGYYSDGNPPMTKIGNYLLIGSASLMLLFAGATSYVLKSLSFDPLYMRTATIVPGPAHWLFSAWFLMMVVGVGVWTISAWWKSKEQDRKTIGLWIFGSFSFAGSAATTYFLFVQGKLGWYWYPPLEFVICFFLAGALIWRLPLEERATYATWTRKLGGFWFFAFTASLLVGLVYTQESKALAFLNGIIFLASFRYLTRRIHRSAQQLLDSRLFKGTVGYLDKVKEKMERIRETAYTYDALASSIVEAVRETFPVEMAAVYFFDTEKKKLILMAQSGMKNPKVGNLRFNRDSLAILEDDPLIQYITGSISERNLLVIREEITHGPQRRQLEVEAGSTLSRIEGEVGAPFLFGGAVKGMLIIGKKSGNRMFHEKDLEAIYRFSRLGEELMRYILGMEQEIRHTANYSHNMANRIKGLLSSLQFVLSPFAKSSLSEPMRKMLELAQDAAGGLNQSFERNTKRSNLILRLVRDEYETEPLDVGQIMKKTCEGFEHQAQEKEIHLSIQFDGPAMVAGNKDDLIQLIENLIGNALRYVPLGGHIAVKGENINGSFQVVVQDDGEGIDPTNLEHIWEFGWQVKDSKKGSSGLGLSYVWEVVKAHKGKIWAESQGKGTGTKFTFVIPLLKSQPVERPSTEFRKEATG
jgi:signal transduction histidine kinase